MASTRQPAPDDWAARVGMPTPARRRQRADAPCVPYIVQMMHALRGISTRVAPSLHRNLLLALASFCNPDGSECFPSIEALANLVGVARYRVSRALKELEIAVWIVRTPRYRAGRGGQTSTRYTVRLGGGVIVVLPRTRPGRRGLVNKAIPLPEGVADLTAKRAQRAAHVQTAPDK